MALGRNHRIFNIGNSSGSYGISRVYHDSTLSGDGTLSSLLGVVDAGDTEVNEFVYNNSGDIIDVNNVVQSNSSNWNDISAYQENSGSFQPSGNYIPFTATDNPNMFKTNSALVFQEADNKHCTYLGSYDIHLQHVDILLNINNQSLLSTARLTFRTKSDSAYVDREKIHKWDNVSDYTQNNSANWNEVSSKLDTSAFTAWSASQEDNNYELSAGNGISLYDDDVNKITRIDVTAQGGNPEVENYVINNSATINDVNTTYQNASGTYLTAVDLSNYYTKNETSGADELASAFNNIPAGDPDVNSYVQNNSATINDVNNTYQQNSANYLTAHQSLDGYATTAWVEEQGYLTAHQDISNKLDASAFSDVSGTFLTAVPAGYATTGEVNSVSSILSAAIDAQSGNVYTGIDPIVVNNDDKAISANTWAFSAGDGISFVDDNVNKITRIDVTAQGGNAEVESYVQTNSGTIDDAVTAYQTASSTYLTAVNIPASADWNEATNVVQTNSGTWNGVSSKLDTSAFTLSALNDASANNIVLTASLPATPDANTLYLIPET